jgi:GNAT superfamily N-acetyltransferase
MEAHHYLGIRRLVGESLRYVAEEGGKWLALVGWGSAAFKCGPRDRWIGWTPEQQWRRLRYIANNLRFLVLPEARRPNLASQVLAANLRRLSRDWQAVFGHPIVLVETFVDPRFTGGCYRAAGWQELGSTKGYRRNGGRYYFHGQPKRVWVRLLHRRGREWLTAAFDVPSLCPGGSLTLQRQV